MPDTNTYHHVTITPGRPARVLQFVQGVYYVLGGLAVALAIDTIQGPADLPRRWDNLWSVRIISLAVAGFGVALILSGRRHGTGFVPAWVAMGVAMLLLAQSAAGMALGELPLTFLLDAALEVLFFGTWVVVMLAGMDRDLGRSTPMPSA